MGGTGETLVVIEDDHNISDLVALYLRRDGFRVLQADDGEGGLAIVDREHPSLVIVDIGLPGELDGYDVCRRLRNVQGAAAGHGAIPEPGRARAAGTSPCSSSAPGTRRSTGCSDWSSAPTTT